MEKISITEIFIELLNTQGLICKKSSVLKGRTYFVINDEIN